MKINVSSKKGFVIDYIRKIDKRITLNSQSIADLCNNNQDKLDIKESDVSNAIMFFREQGYEMPRVKDGLTNLYTIDPNEISKIEFTAVKMRKPINGDGKRRTPSEILIDNKITELEKQLDALKLLRNSGVDVGSILNVKS